MWPNGTCWKCGRQVTAGLLFCLKEKRKCGEQFKRGQDRQVRKSKKAGYGAAGSTH